MTTKDVLALALEALEEACDNRCNAEYNPCYAREAITAIKQEQVQPYTYASTQATNCASCGVHKHTPLRVDFMGGYVCLTCIDVRLEELHDAATLHSKQISNWHEKHDALLEQQLAAPSKEWNDENVIAWCVERGIQAAHPAPQRQPLTAQEVDAILSQHDYDLHGDCIKYIVRMTERAHHIGEEP